MASLVASWVVAPPGFARIRSRRRQKADTVSAGTQVVLVGWCGRALRRPPGPFAPFAGPPLLIVPPHAGKHSAAHLRQFRRGARRHSRGSSEGACCRVSALKAAIRCHATGQRPRSTLRGAAAVVAAGRPARGGRRSRCPRTRPCPVATGSAGGAISVSASVVTGSGPGLDFRGRIGPRLKRTATTPIAVVSGMARITTGRGDQDPDQVVGEPLGLQHVEQRPVEDHEQQQHRQRRPHHDEGDACETLAVACSRAGRMALANSRRTLRSVSASLQTAVAWVVVTSISKPRRGEDDAAQEHRGQDQIRGRSDQDVVVPRSRCR